MKNRVYISSAVDQRLSTSLQKITCFVKLRRTW